MKLLLTVVVVSMFLTPFLNEAGSAIASRIEKERGSLMLPREEAESGDYVLVCGFGRVGQAVCDLLTAKLVRYKAFDMDPYRVAEARDKGLPVFYGDARRPDVLQARDPPSAVVPTRRSRRAVRSHATDFDPLAGVHHRGEAIDPLSRRRPRDRARLHAHSARAAPPVPVAGRAADLRPSER